MILLNYLVKYLTHPPEHLFPKIVNSRKQPKEPPTNLTTPQCRYQPRTRHCSNSKHEGANEQRRSRRYSPGCRRKGGHKRRSSTTIHNESRPVVPAQSASSFAIKSEASRKGSSGLGVRPGTRRRRRINGPKEPEQFSIASKGESF